MNLELLESAFKKHKATELFGRYITNENILPLLKKMEEKITLEVLGKSVLGKPIYGVKLGQGSKRILMWSQMHGNESTTTKALFDLFNTLLCDGSEFEYLLEGCSFFIIPILNPDGAEAYTRINANEVDLNRDAQNLTQPESHVLRNAFNQFKPDFCFNLHGQRTIFSAGVSNKPAIVSFLSPAQDDACTVTSNRKIAMEIIAEMNKTLQLVIPDQVGVYDDAFNLNCVGDTFQSENVPTILFEAGHFPNDYNRENTRKLIYMSYLTSLDFIANNTVSGVGYENYFDIPENGKCFLDIIIRNAKTENGIVDIGIQYKEKLFDKGIKFLPETVKMEKLEGVFGHREIEASGLEVFNESGKTLKMNSENVFVILNNEKTLLLPK